MARSGQDPPAIDRRKGHGDLQFGIILPARLLPGLRPVEVKDVFALAVAFGIERHHPDDLAGLGRHQMARRPARASTHRPALLKRKQEPVRRERIATTGAAIPVLRRNRRNIGLHDYRNGVAVIHGSDVGPRAAPVKGDSSRRSHCRHVCAPGLPPKQIESSSTAPSGRPDGPLQPSVNPDPSARAR